MRWFSTLLCHWLHGNGHGHGHGASGMLRGCMRSRGGWRVPSERCLRECAAGWQTSDNRYPSNQNDLQEIQAAASNPHHLAAQTCRPHPHLTRLPLRPTTQTTQNNKASISSRFSLLLTFLPLTPIYSSPNLTPVLQDSTKFSSNYSQSTQTTHIPFSGPIPPRVAPPLP